MACSTRLDGSQRQRLPHLTCEFFSWEGGQWPDGRGLSPPHVAADLRTVVARRPVAAYGFLWSYPDDA